MLRRFRNTIIDVEYANLICKVTDYAESAEFDDRGFHELDC